MENIKRLVKIGENSVVKIQMNKSNSNFIILETYPIHNRGLWNRVKRTYNFFFRKSERNIVYLNNNECTSLAKEIWNISNYIPENTFYVEKVYEDSILPKRMTDGSSGYDVATPESFTLLPGERKLIDFGFRMEILPGYEIQMRNRSGMGYKKGVIMLLGVGTIDSDYRGTFKAPLLNIGRNSVSFNRGDRIAQFIVNKTTNIKLKKGKVKINTERGSGGFGSTGN